jgi:hypothetical protein
MDQKKFSLKFSALKTNYNENYNARQMKKQAEEAARRASKPRKERRSKLERSNSKTRYSTAKAPANQTVPVQNLDAGTPVESEQVFEMMDMIREDNGKTYF